jgi:hypothetical protein
LWIAMRGISTNKQPGPFSKPLQITAWILLPYRCLNTSSLCNLSFDPKLNVNH